MDIERNADQRMYSTYTKEYKSNKNSQFVYKINTLVLKVSYYVQMHIKFWVISTHS